MLSDRAHEIEEFLGVTGAQERLAQGFHHNHALVAASFRAANPVTDDELLEWYRTTDAYIWELTAYHLDPGFNYSGMCEGIVARFTTDDEVLALGDGVGDLSMALHDKGIYACYHDLTDSLTAGFAQHRFQTLYGNGGPGVWTTNSWEPEFGEECWNAIIALDFMEHLINVEEWITAIHKALVPGGRLMAQNAFAIGDNDHGGSIPMHLTRNNRFEHDWVSTVTAAGFDHEIAEWWIKR